VSELTDLITSQEKDDTHRVYSLSLDAFPSGADVVHLRPRGIASDPRHGTLSMAKRYGCKCEKCREASAKYQREYNRRRGTKTQFVCACCGSTDIKREKRGAA
jgi:hypothetical protein